MSTFKGKIIEVDSENADKHRIRYDDTTKRFPTLTTVQIDGRINPRLLDSCLGGEIIVVTNERNYVTAVDVIRPGTKTPFKLLRRDAPGNHPT